MTDHNIEKLTSSYEKWLVESLRDKKEVVAYLKVAIDEFERDGDIEALLLALHHVAHAHRSL